MQTASDAAIWDRALASCAAIITKDEVFAQRKVLSDSGVVVVWIRLSNARRLALLAWFRTVLPDILAAHERGETLVKVTVGERPRGRGYCGSMRARRDFA